ncbi:MAG: hypothetical protein HQ556_05725 [Candidatus Marinimicrobia bacterium]|nr:hypothetical protein [Candidatus Neomarinimicrobiota bacterium]
MSTTTESEQGWKPIPILLKILFGVIVLWTLGSIIGLSMRYESGLPFFGVYVYGFVAGLIVVLLDIAAPLTFLFALWTRKSWAPTFAFTYMSIFILNSVVAFFMFKEQLGLMQILIPTIVNVIFVGVIYWSRNYFKR